MSLQEKFKHYKDLWRLDLESWEWEQLPGKGGPCARSGHRMALHRNRLLLFGGFQDTGKETVYAPGFHKNSAPQPCMRRFLQEGLHAMSLTCRLAWQVMLSKGGTLSWELRM